MLKKLKYIVYENMIFCLLALLPFVSLPAIVNAQQVNQPVLFTEPLSVSRGKIIPQSFDAEVWPKSYYCDIVKRDWGWSNCDGFDAFIVLYNNEIDTLLMEEPNSDGFVKFDDWDPKNLDKQVKAIEKELQASLKAQGERSNSTISFEGWRVFPTLNKTENIMFYATDISFDGEVSTNIKASVFDRYGYNVFRIVPFSSELNKTEIENLVLDMIESYKPNVNDSYSSFISGDKLAAGGAIAVLATLVGVKYGKAAAAGAFAIALIFLKKAWFLLLLPLLWIGRLFKRRSK